MSDKLNHSDLSALLAKEAKISGAKAELFTKTMFELIIEGLEQDGIVKINGLGTFKITDVADRSSVNVNTGEKIEIKGHKKITFLPADTLKESVNQPFAMFEPVEVDENYKDEDDSIETVVAENVAEELTDVVETVEEATEIVEEVPVVEEIEEEMPVEESGVEEPVAVVDILPEEYAPANSDTQEPITDNGIEEEVAIEEESADDEPEQAQTEKEEIVLEENSVVSVVEEPVEEVGESVVEDNVEPESVETVEENNDIEPVEEASDKENEEERETVGTKVQECYGYDELEEEHGWFRRNYIKLLLLVMLTVVVYLIYVFLIDKKNNNIYEETPQIYVQQTAVESEPVDETATLLVPLQESTPVEEINTEEATTSPVPLQESVPVEENRIEEESKPVVPLQESITVEGGSVSIVAELAARSDKSITDADTTMYNITGKMTVHKVTANDRLAKIANDYYGSRKLWPYIAKYNNLQKPYGLSVGMELVIPELQPK
ncbi:MAG: HU family DNA-binding protein [Bacteroidaceae bacterium]|nr:HU family DNA-binding protein [Bacteroidaceae bacterium]